MVVLALLGALVFATSAHAEAPAPADGSTVLEAPASGESPVTSPDGAEGGSGSGEVPASTPEVPVEEAPESVIPVEPPPTETVIPVEPPPTETVVPVEPPPTETVVPVEPPPVEAVVPTEAAPTVPTETIEKAETAASLVGAEETGKGGVEVSTQAGDTHSASVAVASEEAPISPAPAPSESAVSIHSAAEQAGSTAEIVSLGVAVRKTASKLSGQLSCELSALSGRSAGGCGAGPFGTQSLLLISRTTLSGVSASLDPAANGVIPERGSHGSPSAVGGAPASPPPGSSTGGSSGAAAGASGPAPSAFFSLACLLLLGAPRAMRRLRLSSRPLLTASFVLIPERPG